MKNLILEMEEYAKEQNVPIMQKDGIAFLMKYIKSHNIKNVLEIGSAIGYSAILMASSTADVKVTTIERDENSYIKCLKNVKKSGLEEKINVVFQDALEVNLAENTYYDLIFIDAAKGQYQKFFEKFKYFLAPGGAIITDKIESKNLRRLVEHIEEYHEFLKNNEEFDTKIYDIGDGIALSVRKNEE